MGCGSSTSDEHVKQMKAKPQAEIQHQSLYPQSSGQVAPAGEDNTVYQNAWGTNGAQPQQPSGTQQSSNHPRPQSPIPQPPSQDPGNVSPPPSNIQQPQPVPEQPQQDISGAVPVHPGQPSPPPPTSPPQQPVLQPSSSNPYPSGYPGSGAYPGQTQSGVYPSGQAPQGSQGQYPQQQPMQPEPQQLPHSPLVNPNADENSNPLGEKQDSDSGFFSGISKSLTNTKESITTSVSGTKDSITASVSDTKDSITQSATSFFDRLPGRGSN